MAKKKAFTVEQLRKFQMLALRLKDLGMHKRAISEQIAKLEQERVNVEEQIAQIEKQINDDFAELKNAEELLIPASTADEATNPTVQVKDTGYVKKETKEALLKKILSDYKRANPNTDTISYTEVKRTLDSQYNIQTKSITNFFIDLLPNYKTVGGNRNKAIVLPKG